MGIATVLRYLTGDRDAILTIARSPTAIGAAALLVLSAALAREYDGSYLLGPGGGAELLTPFLASLFLAVVLHVVLSRAFGTRAEGFRQLRAFPVFLTLYWFTAPIAWLYAVPYERFMSPYDAAMANLGTLCVVSIWRVLLISRVASVLYGAPYWRALAVVLLVADAIVAAAGFFSAISVGLASGMSGARLPPSQQLVGHFASDVTTLALFAFIPVAIAAAWAIKSYSGSWAVRDAVRNRTRVTLWAGAILSVALWLPILSETQREQRLAWQVKELLWEGAAGDAVSLMSSHQRSDFPPHWNAETRRSRHYLDHDLLAVVQATLDERTSEWVRSMYRSELRGSLVELEELYDPEDIRKLAALLPRLEEGPELAWIIAPLLRDAADRYTNKEDVVHEDIEALLDLSTASLREVDPQ